MRRREPSYEFDVPQDATERRLQRRIRQANSLSLSSQQELSFFSLSRLCADAETPAATNWRLVPFN